MYQFAANQYSKITALMQIWKSAYIFVFIWT